MTEAVLGLSVQSSQAVTAAADLDKFTGAAGKADRGATELATATRQMAAAMGSVTAVLSSIERNTNATAAAMERGQKATEMVTRSYGQADLVMQRFIERQTGVARATAQWEGPLSNISEELDRMRARFNPLFAAQQRFEAATQEINRAQRLGAITADEATAAIMREQAAYDQLTASIRANSAAARAGSASRANTAHTTNLVFQAQDIAMMTAMGQAPLMLAMQQGSQVGPILQQMGSGRAAIAGIGTALASLVSPINLITLGVIGFGAAGVQALMGMMSGTEDATTALEAHSKWLDEILLGYEATREAAAGAVEQAMRLPQGSLESNLSAGRDSAIQAELEAFEQLIAKQEELQERLNILSLGQGAFDDIIEAAQPMADMAFSLDMTNGELGQLHSELTRIANSNVDAEVRQWAVDLLNYMDQARAARAETESLGAALNALPGSINIDIAFRGLGVSDAIQQITNLTPELRSTREIINDIFEQEAGQARTTSELQALVTAASDAMAALDEQDRRAEELKASRAAASAGGRATDQWGAANDNFQQRIDQTRLEIELFGQSTYEVTRQQAAFDLLNQAKAAGIPIDATVTQQINTMAAEYAGLNVELERMQQQAQLATSINNILANGFTNLWTGIIDGSKSAGEAIGDLLKQLGQLLINQAFMSLFGGGTAGGIGGALAGIFMPNALGGVYDSPGLSAYSNQVVNSPTVFPFARGIGLMGEAGPEAIMPLSRGPDGRLGVAARNDNSRSGTVVQIIDQRKNAPAIERQEGIGPNGELQVRIIVRDEWNRMQDTDEFNTAVGNAAARAQRDRLVR